ISEVKPKGKLAKLVFTWPVKLTAEVPRKTMSVPLADGTAKVSFSFYNASDVEAQNIEIWINICNECRYTKEPAQFQKLPGMDEHQRYRKFAAINAGTGLYDMSVEVTPPAGAPGM